jgi:anti-sigma factor RsiW
MHISQSTLEHYLDGSLGDATRRKVWGHLQGCDRCQRRLQNETAMRDDLRGELTVFNQSKTRDLGELLPGIINEARQPALRHVKRSAAAFVLVLVLVTAFPMLRHAENSRLEGPLVNVPRATQIVNDDPQQIATDESSAPISREISLKYASLVPPPQATAAASFEPGD